MSAAIIDPAVPSVVNLHGELVYRVVSIPDDVDRCRVILDPTTGRVGWAWAESVCLATPDGLYLNPFVSGVLDMSCHRLAFHDGPHAYVDLDGNLATYDECRCQDGVRVDLGSCWHTSTGAQHPKVDPALHLFVDLTASD